MYIVQRSLIDNLTGTQLSDVREEIAGRGGAVRYEGEDLGYKTLLDRGVLCDDQCQSNRFGDALIIDMDWETHKLSVEFCEARLAGVVEDQDGVDHCIISGDMMDVRVVTCTAR